MYALRHTLAQEIYPFTPSVIAGANATSLEEGG